MAFKKLKLWFDKELAVLLADKISVKDTSFKDKYFVKLICEKIDLLELKDRVEVFADALFECLGSDYKYGIKVLLSILGPVNKNEVGMFTEFYWVMPIAKYVEKYGVDDLKISLKAIEEITQRNTGEYAIRPFLEKYTKSTLAQMEKWTKHKNSHVSRLSSEGVRPRLPWASKLDMFVEDPNAIVPILNNLKDDSSKYVQKSVANCLNDIIKDNIDVAQTILEDWRLTQMTDARRWIIKHALRKQIKVQDKWALNFLEQL